MNKYILASIFLVFAFCKISIAGPSSQELMSIQRQQDSILLQEEERERKQFEDFMQENKDPESIEVLINEEPLNVSGDECIQVEKIEISGATYIPLKKLMSIAARYENQCLKIGSINNLLKELSNEYIENGYITSRAFVDTSSTSAGVLKIIIVEGKIEKIILNEGERNLYYLGKVVFAGLEGGALNLRDIEQGLEQLNRLPSFDAKVEFAPGELVGGTIVKVNIDKKKSWRFSAGLDNYGQSSSGQYQHTLSLEKDNFVGIGDQIAAYWTESTSFLEKSLTERQDTRNSRSFSMYASMPYGYWTFAASMSSFSYHTPIYGLNTSYKSSGISDTYNLIAERIVSRGENYRTSLSVALNGRNVKNFIEDIKIRASSYHLRVLSFGIKHQCRLLGGSLNVSANYDQGISALGSKRQQYLAQEVPRSVFSKYVGNIQWYRPFSLAKELFYYQFSAHGQFSEQTLFGAERISIGSKYSVRGFHEGSISGDQGGYVRQEMGWNIPVPEAFTSESLINGAQLFAAYDFGGLVKDRKDPFEQGSMQGISLGARTTGPLAFEVVVSKAIDTPNFIKKRDCEVLMSLKYTF